MSNMFEKLKAPFPPEKVSWRLGSTNIDRKTNKPYDGKSPSGIALAYIDARDVMDRLDEAVTPTNWQDKYEFIGARTIACLSIRIGDEWISKHDGAGDSAVESEKGAISDALKRAAVKWGIGRYLYDIEGPWVQIVPKGRSWVIAKNEYSKLQALLPGAKIEGSDLPDYDAWEELKSDMLLCSDTLDELKAWWKETKTGNQHFVALESTKRQEFFDEVFLPFGELLKKAESAHNADIR